MQAIKDGGLLEYYPLEDNRYELGGFANLKSWLERAKVGFTAKAKALNLTPPRGIMLVGMPGCGKSLAAKTIAREWQLPLLKLDAGRLFDKFVGESEKNFRKAIEMAESLSPIVLWIDEIEKAMVAGGGSGEADAGLSRRLFGAFLTWLQEKKQEVFVVATANNLTGLPPELLRKGRFDEIFFVDLPDDAERDAIWKFISASASRMRNILISSQSSVPVTASAARRSNRPCRSPVSRAASENTADDRSAD